MSSTSRAWDFTKRKFLSLFLDVQHKNCADLICAIYKHKQKHQAIGALLETYQDLAMWMQAPALPNDSLKTLSDRYHYHLKQAKIQLKEHNLLPTIACKDRPTAAPVLPIAIYFDNIRSAHNVGSMLRTIEAFSLGSAHFSAATPFATHKQVMDAAMGASEWVKCHQASTLEQLPRPIIVLETATDAIPLQDFLFPETFTLVVGNEEYGCSAETLQRADYIVQIPLHGHKNSLNVANAFAIVAAEISRQFH